MYISFLISNDFIYFYIVVQLQLSPFSHHYSALPSPPPTFHIQSSPTPLSMSMGPLYKFLDLTTPLLSPIIPLQLPLWAL